MQLTMYAVALLSAAFSLGGIANLFLRYRTRTLRIFLLFILSMFFISLGFLLRTIPGGNSGLETLSWIASFGGSALNILIIPHLTAVLLERPLRPWLALIQGFWFTAFIVLSVLFFLFPRILFIQYGLSIMQILSIAVALTVLALKLPGLKSGWWFKGIRMFLFTSAAFLILLTLDIIISLTPVRALAPMDNLSLPIYLVTLSLGIFFTSAKFLSRPALLEGNELTTSCVEFYGLTPREKEITEALISGRTNKLIAEELFISEKTVENHLSNIYPKFGVNSRARLIHSIVSWKEE